MFPGSQETSGNVEPKRSGWKREEEAEAAKTFVGQAGQTEETTSNMSARGAFNPPRTQGSPYDLSPDGHHGNSRFWLRFSTVFDFRFHARLGAKDMKKPLDVPDIKPLDVPDIKPVDVPDFKLLDR